MLKHNVLAYFGSTRKLLNSFFVKIFDIRKGALINEARGLAAISQSLSMQQALLFQLTCQPKRLALTLHNMPYNLYCVVFIVRGLLFKLLKNSV